MSRPSKREIQAIAKQLGSRGGKARSAKLSPERRSEIARLGGLATKAKREAKRKSDE